MTIIAPDQALLAVLTGEAGTPAPLASAASDAPPAGEQAASFLAMLQQAAAVLPQAIEVIRSELSDAALPVDEALPEITPQALLSRLEAALAMQVAGAGNVAGDDALQLTVPDGRALQITAGTVDPSLAASPVAGGELPESPEMLDAISPTLQPAGTGGEATAASASPHRPVQTPVGHPGWADEIGVRLTLLGARGEHTASLRLSPEHLGPLEIRIAIKDDQASVWFGAAHAQTREAIEQALPRLREMLQAQGLTLSDSGVFDESPAGQQSFSSQGGGAPDAQPPDTTAQMAHYRGLLDLYA